MGVRVEVANNLLVWEGVGLAEHIPFLFGRLHNPFPMMRGQCKSATGFTDSDKGIEEHWHNGEEPPAHLIEAMSQDLLNG